MTDTNVAVGKFWKSSIEAPRDTFKIAGQDYEFVDFWPKSKSIRAWHKKYESGTHTDRLQLLPLSEIAVSTLKELPVWGALTKEEQDKLINGTAAMEQIEQDMINKLNKVSNKGKRKLKYVGIPRELVCCKCSCPENATRIKIQPALVIKNAEKKGLSIEEYCKTWACSTCEPRKRGKACDPKYANIPRIITCHKCQHTEKIAPSVLIKNAEKKGLSIEEYGKIWACSSCEPRHRGKRSSGKWSSLPKELVCKTCGKVQPQHPSMTEKQATLLGKTFQEFVDAWNCRSCRPKVKRVMTGKRARKSDGSCAPTDLVCKCGNKVTYPLNIVKQRAEKKGLTLEKFIKTYVCQTCKPTKGRYKKVK